MRSILLLLLVAATTLSACINDEEPKRVEVVHVGESLPDFSAPMKDGSVVTGEYLRSRVSVVVFFHTSCPDCRQLLPQIQRLYNEYSTHNVAFAIISREEGESSIASFWEAHNLTMPYSPQSDRTLYNLFATSLIPRVYISDDRGLVRSIFTDNPTPSYDKIKAALDKIL